METPTQTAVIFSELNDLLLKRADGSRLIHHNLEQGLGNERIVREVLVNFLPARYAVGKGKIVNAEGDLSPHCDVIVYDALNCPRLFVDENLNQIIPAEGVYLVLEVKTTLTKRILIDAFDHLKRVYEVLPRPENRSTNDLVRHSPPDLQILALGYRGKLPTLARHFSEANRAAAVETSHSSYSPKSPGYADHSGRTNLVSAVTVLGLGVAHEMLAGWLTFREYRRFTLGVFLTGLAEDLAEVELPPPSLYLYFNHIFADELNALPKLVDRPIVD